MDKEEGDGKQRPSNMQSNENIDVDDNIIQLRE